MKTKTDYRDQEIERDRDVRRADYLAETGRREGKTPSKQEDRGGGRERRKKKADGSLYQSPAGLWATLNQLMFDDVDEGMFL